MRIIFAAILSSVAMVAIVSIVRTVSPPAVKAESECFVEMGEAEVTPVQPMLSGALSALQNSAVVCPAAGGTPARTPASGTPASSIFVYNTSTTCIRVGGVGVTASTGAQIGENCDLGMGISVDARSAYCISEGVGTVTVQVLYGVE